VSASRLGSFEPVGADSELETEALHRLNTAPPVTAREIVRSCCAAGRFGDRLVSLRPFASREALFEAAERTFDELSDADWSEAFAGHPRLGDVDDLRRRYGRQSGEWSVGEQAGLNGADDDLLRALADGNRRYEARFGHVFLVCASGKSAAEILALLEARLDNPPAVERQVAAGEQRRITRLRLEKWLHASPTGARPVEAAR
jgi:2-oxo-4-hydroxy-4-carboxy-5-ureidoimidazoline decarboxylase